MKEMRTNDKLHIDEIRIKEPKDRKEWMDRFLQIVLDSESHPVSQTRGEENVVRERRAKK